MEDTTMKKTYINPEIEVVKIASQIHMLAGSPDPAANGLDPAVDPIDAGDLDGRQFDW